MSILHFGKMNIIIPQCSLKFLLLVGKTREEYAQIVSILSEEFSEIKSNYIGVAGNVYDRHGMTSVTLRSSDVTKAFISVAHTSVLLNNKELNATYITSCMGEGFAHRIYPLARLGVLDALVYIRPEPLLSERDEEEARLVSAQLELALSQMGIVYYSESDKLIQFV